MSHLRSLALVLALALALSLTLAPALAPAPALHLMLALLRPLLHVWQMTVQMVQLYQNFK